LFHAEDAPEGSIETQIPTDVFSVELDGIKTMITTMEKDIRSRSANHVLLEIMLQGKCPLNSLRACQFNSILHVPKLIILERHTIVISFKAGT
jgi:hypothetical protein